jgi:hypothetical protein
MEKLPSPQGSIRNGPQPDFATLNRYSLIRFGMAVALSLLMASTAPSGLVLATFNGLLFLCSLTAMVVAVTMSDRLFAGHFTRWDEAAALAVASQVAGWFVDPAAVQAALMAAGAVAP